MPDVKLGIAVVYLLNPDQGRLIDIHFDFIKRNTTLNYRIYGVCNRLDNELKKLLNRQELTICEIPTSTLRGSAENNYYLKALIENAISDGCTHVAILHVDSFPVRRGWAEHFVEKLDGIIPLVSAMISKESNYKPHTCFIMFTSDFYTKYKPELLLSEEDKSSWQYKDYCREYPHEQDSGSGFGFTLFKHGLGWIPLEMSNQNSDHYIMASIYGDTVFHLSGVSREAKTFGKSLVSQVPEEKNHVLSVPDKVLSSLLPQGLLYNIKQKLSKYMFFKREHDENMNIQNQIIEKLFTDPIAYINWLRGVEPDK